MRILGTLAAVLLLTGVAFADETTVQSGEITKQTTQSTTVQLNPSGPSEMSQQSDTKVETRKHQVTADVDGNDATRSDTKVEKKSSTSTTLENPGSNSQTYSETQHEQSSQRITQ
jgi:hypothetical protein